MNENRRKPGFAFWFTAAVVMGVVVLAYPLSWGPVIWIQTKPGHPAWLGRFEVVVYTPIERLAVATNDRPFNWYSHLLEYASWWVKPSFHKSASPSAPFRQTSR